MAKTVRCVPSKMVYRPTVYKIGVIPEFLFFPGFSRNSTLLTCNLHWCKVPDIRLGCWHFDRPNPQFLKFAPVLGEIGIGRLDLRHNCFPYNQNPAIPENNWQLIQFKDFSVRWGVFFRVSFWNSCINHHLKKKRINTAWKIMFFRFWGTWITFITKPLYKNIFIVCVGKTLNSLLA